MSTIRFGGVYHLKVQHDQPKPVQQQHWDKALAQLKEKDPSGFFHNKTGGIPMWVNNDNFGQDADRFGPKLKWVNRLQKFHFEPKSLFGMAFNQVVEWTLKPIQKQEALEEEMSKDAKNLLVTLDAEGNATIHKNHPY